jgi:hypothetical protein
VESLRKRPARTQCVKQKAKSVVAALVRRGIVNVWYDADFDFDAMSGELMVRMDREV